MCRTAVHNGELIISEEKIEAPGLLILRGDNTGRYPYCNTLVIGEDRVVVVDPHSSRSAIEAITSRTEMLLFTHYHTDHIRYHQLFHCEFYAPAPDRLAFSGIEGLAQHTGILGSPYETQWFKRLESRSWRMPEVHNFYKDGDSFSLGSVTLQVVHLPGHTKGHSGFLIPEYNLLFTADVDFTDFGPWYGNACSSIEDFIATLEKIRQMSPRYVVTAHERWVVYAEELEEEIRRYQNIIQQRDEMFLELLKKPMDLNSLLNLHPIYGKSGMKNDFMINFMEAQMIEKHMQRLLKKGLIEKTGDGRYVRK